MNCLQPTAWYENDAVPASRRSPCMDARTELSEPLTQNPTPTPSSKLTVYHDAGSEKYRQLINLSNFTVSLGEDYCATVLGMYVFSGEDCTSAFKGKGKGRRGPEKAGKEPKVL